MYIGAANMENNMEAPQKIKNGLPWLVWLSRLSASLWTKGSLVRFPVRAYAWVAGRVPTRDLVLNPGMCPDWKWNQWPFGSQAGTQSTQSHQPGLTKYFLIPKSQLCAGHCSRSWEDSGAQDKVFALMGKFIFWFGGRQLQNKFKNSLVLSAR